MPLSQVRTNTYHRLVSQDSVRFGNSRMEPRSILPVARGSGTLCISQSLEFIYSQSQAETELSCWSHLLSVITDGDLFHGWYDADMQSLWKTEEWSCSSSCPKKELITRWIHNWASVMNWYHLTFFFWISTKSGTRTTNRVDLCLNTF